MASQDENKKNVTNTLVIAINENPNQLCSIKVTWRAIAGSWRTDKSVVDVWAINLFNGIIAIDEDIFCRNVWSQ